MQRGVRDSSGLAGHFPGQFVIRGSKYTYRETTSPKLVPSDSPASLEHPKSPGRIWQDVVLHIVGYFHNFGTLQYPRKMVKRCVGGEGVQPPETGLTRFLKIQLSCLGPKMCTCCNSFQVRPFVKKAGKKMAPNLLDNATKNGFSEATDSPTRLCEKWNKQKPRRDASHSIF